MHGYTAPKDIADHATSMLLKGTGEASSGVQGGNSPQGQLATGSVRL